MSNQRYSNNHNSGRTPLARDVYKYGNTPKSAINNSGRRENSKNNKSANVNSNYKKKKNTENSISKNNTSKNNKRPMTKKEKLRMKKRKRRNKKILLGAEIFVLLMALLGGSLYLMPNSKAFMVKAFTSCAPGRSLLSHLFKDDYNKNVYDDSVDKSAIKTVDLGDGYTNIALFGIDPRDGEFDSDTHTDTMMIVSINNETHDVKLISLYRDTLLRMETSDGDYTYEKANTEYFLNGPQGTLSMINENLDLDITEYAIVNFSGLAKIIDALGGIDVNITGDERILINGYLTETRKVTGMDAPDLEEDQCGLVHLSGLQATAYCRIRYVTYTDENGVEYNNDYGRTARQRSVMNKILEKAKSAGATKLLKVANTLIKDNNINGEKILTTNITWSRIVDLLTVAVDCNLTETTGFPYDVYTPDKKGGAYYGYVVPMGLKQNVVRLHEDLFPDLTYTPSSTVKKINDYIIDETGVYPPDEDSSDYDSSDDSSYSNSSSYSSSSSYSDNSSYDSSSSYSNNSSYDSSSSDDYYDDSGDYNSYYTDSYDSGY